MSIDRLTDLQRVIQTLIPVQDALLEYHFKMNAMLEVFLASDLTQHSRVTLHDFLWLLNDMIEQSQALSESSLNTLLKAESRMESPGGASGNNRLH